MLACMGGLRDDGATLLSAQAVPPTIRGFTSGAEDAPPVPGSPPADRGVGEPRRARRVIVLASETYLPDVNGAAYFVHRLAVGLASRGHAVHVICPGLKAETRTPPAPFAVHRVPAWPVPGYPQVRFAMPVAGRRALRRLLGEIGPDVVHVQNHFPLGRAAVHEARRTSTAVVATNHFLPDNFTCFVDGWPKRITEALERALWRDLGRIYRHAALVTAPSSYAARATSSRASLGEVRAVSCGVDLARFSAGEPAATRFRTAYGVPSRFSVLHVGRLDPDKHVERLIDGLALARRSIDAQLVVVGRGEQLAALRRHARAAGVQDAVCFCGFVPDELLPGAYSGADVYANAGRAELQSIASLEAMAAGKPLLLARAHALPLLVTEGENGWTHQPGAAHELAAQLVTLHDDPGLRDSMGQASRSRAFQHALGETVSTFEALYEGACSGAAVSVAGRNAAARGSGSM